MLRFFISISESRASMSASGTWRFSSSRNSACVTLNRVSLCHSVSSPSNPTTRTAIVLTDYPVLRSPFPHVLIQTRQSEACHTRVWRKRRGILRLGRAGSLRRAAPGHQQAEPSLIRFGRLEAHDPPLIHHRYPVRKRAHLVELSRDQKNRRALIPLLHQPAMDELDGPDVDTARRLGREQDLRVAGHLAGDDDLLLVSARQRPRRRLDAGCADVELLDQASRPVLDRVESQQEAVPREQRRSLASENEVVGDRIVQDEADATPVLRNVPDPRLALFARISGGHVNVAKENLAAGRTPCARQHLHQFALPVALYARNPEDLPLSKLERDAAQGGDASVGVRGQVLDAKRDGPRRRRFLVHPQQHRATDHHRGDLLLVGLLGDQVTHHLAAAHDGDAVGDVQDLLELVADEDDGLTVLDQAAKHSKQLDGLLWREHPGGLVEDEDVRAAVEHLDDLGPLLQADGQYPRQCVWIKREAVLARQRLDVFARSPIVVEPGPDHRLAPEHDVFAYREDRDEHEMLVHHPDAKGDGIARTADARGLAVDDDLP